jgi:hypothetical protein
MESTFYAVHHTQQCLASGKLKAAHVFLHDVERPLEKHIMSQYLIPKNGARHLGHLKGPRGVLAGFTFTAPDATTTLIDAVPK